MAAEVPLVVDLDGSLLRSDMLLETLAACTRNAPLTALLAPLWLLSGRANLKARLAASATVSPEHLPYRQDLLDWLAAERQRGRRVVLATAADESIARSIAGHLGLFDEVMASSASRNLKGEAKRAALVERFGERGFDYAGDSRADLPVWRSARRAIVLADTPGLEAAIGRAGDVDLRTAATPSVPVSIIRALRPHQWTKNLLVFVPLLAAHKLDSGAIYLAVLAFCAFSMAASATYLVNDLADLESDRRNAYKRARPFASGDLGLAWGFVLAPAIMAGALLLAAYVSPSLFLAIVAYVVVSLAYTLWLKRFAVLDVIVLASLYTLRVFAGALAIDVEVSHWLLAFSTFIFLSLALAKRHAEIAALAEDGAAPGRGYRAGDREIVAMFGAASGFMAVVILSLYVSSGDVGRLYRHPAMLWFLLPVMLFWIARVWLLAWRRELHEDPIVFALRDPASYAAGALCAAAVLAAT